MMRYANRDDFGMPEAAFLICRFWLIDAWWWLGRREEARELFVDALGHRNRYGLLAEDIHPADRRAVGEFPADLFDGRADPDRHAAVAKLGGPVLARLILVSNRVSLPGPGASQRAGGLEVALAPAMNEMESVWFGWSGEVVPAGKVRTRAIESEQRSFVVTDLSEEDYQEYYNGFANRVLWPVLHYRIDLTEFNRRDLTGYFRVNQHFATELSKILQPDDLIWVHDYHLIPIAEELRQRGFANRIGFFLHVPFPAPEVVTVLPNHERLLPLLLQYDLVGLQTETDVGNFARYLMAEQRVANRRVFEATDRQLVFSVGGRQTRIGSFPVGIEPEEFSAPGAARGEIGFVRDVVESLGNRALVIGVDRLDYSKGLIQRMEAFERFYALHPEWQNKVTYLQISPKSRSEIPEYFELEQAVGAAAGRINGMYGEVAWTPIRYLNRTYSRASLAGLYRSARAGLVTPLRDGMNLVAKEYVAAQRPDDPGVLILSRFAGSAGGMFRRPARQSLRSGFRGGGDRPRFGDEAGGEARAPPGDLHGSDPESDQPMERALPAFAGAFAGAGRDPFGADAALERCCQSGRCGRWQAGSLRPFHQKDQRQEGERHPADEPEQIDEGLHLRLARDLQRHDFHRALWRAGSSPGWRDKARPPD